MALLYSLTAICAATSKSFSSSESVVGNGSGFTGGSLTGSLDFALSTGDDLTGAGFVSFCGELVSGELFADDGGGAVIAGSGGADTPVDAELCFEDAAFENNNSKYYHFVNFRFQRIFFTF